MPDNPHAIHNLVGDALRESTDLASKEFALFRTEMAANVKSLFLGIAMLIGAAVFAVAAIIWLTQALVEWLGAILESEALAALIVGGALAAIAVGLGLYGRSAMSAATLTPERTVRSVRRDGEVLSERVSG
jgi:nucleoside permease NupC